MNKKIAGIRKDYSIKALNENEIASNAMEQFTHWWNDALKSEIEEVNAMTIATVSKNGLPHARIVLLKNFDERGFVFFSNYNSHKGKELEENPHAALVFFWKELKRQVRIEGTVEKIDPSESDAYFDSRQRGSKIGAWASPQSNVIAGRYILDENVKKFTKEFVHNVPRPPHWGGFRIIPDSIEFWQGRSNRLHDRILYTQTIDQHWKTQRLAP